MQDSFDPLTIVFLVLAVFVLWKLRSVLGQRTGNERPPYDPFARKDPAKPEDKAPATAVNDDNVIPLPGAGAPQRDRATARAEWNDIAPKGSPIAVGLEKIADAEPGFNPRQFLEGAKSAYEAIVLAFSQADRAALKSLLSDEVYEGFERVISEREKNGEKPETTFVAIAQPEITEAEVSGGVAQLTLRFNSKLIAATRDRTGAIVDGDPEAVVDVTDVWTFARTLGSADPNWRLVATEGGA